MTSQRRSSDHSHTGNQVGCEHRIGQQDGPHSPDHKPTGRNAALCSNTSEQPAGALILNNLNDTGSKGTDGLGFAVSDFPFCHAGENDHDAQ